MSSDDNMALSKSGVDAEEEAFAPQHSPTILNASNHSLVVFQERGTFYNAQVLHPGEAVSMTRKETGPFRLVPYRIHAIVGDESCLPTQTDSTRNLVKATAIPAAFVAGCFATAVGAGMLAGPSAALAPLVSGMVVNGVVIDSTALAAGGLLATRASAVADMLLKEKPDFFMNKTGGVRPGERYFVVTGGLADGAVNIKEMPRRKFEEEFTVAAWKRPLRKKILSDPAGATEAILPEDSRDVELLMGEEEEEVEVIAAESRSEAPKSNEGVERKSLFSSLIGR